MGKEYLTGWKNYELSPKDSKLITGGFAASYDCGFGQTAFSCTTTFSFDDGTGFTSTGLVCARSWRAATETVYLYELETFDRDEVSSVSCS